MAASTTESKHKQNISMLMDKLKELTMSAESEADSHLYKRIEGKYFYPKNAIFVKIATEKIFLLNEVI